jgi:hypothetical protein
MPTKLSQSRLSGAAGLGLRAGGAEDGVHGFRVPRQNDLIRPGHRAIWGMSVDASQRRGKLTRSTTRCLRPSHVRATVADV